MMNMRIDIYVQLIDARIREYMKHSLLRLPRSTIHFKISELIAFLFMTSIDSKRMYSRTLCYSHLNKYQMPR
jgi:hypothetical protein